MTERQPFFATQCGYASMAEELHKGQASMLAVSFFRVLCYAGTGRFTPEGFTELSCSTSPPTGNTHL